MTRKIILTVICLLAALAAWTGQVDEVGADMAEKAFRRALVTFAVARTLNGVISVAQGTEVAVEPAGIGMNFTVGQVLDPINDLIERFSAVMLVATSALGLQNILLGISEWWGISVLLIVAVVVFLLTLWVRPAERWQQWGFRAALIVIALRFAVPAIIIGTDLVFDTFLAAQHAAATQALEATSNEISEMSQETVPPPTEARSMLDRLGAFLDDSLDRVNVTEKLDRFRDRLSNASEHIINLIVIFVLQTIVIPILFLYLLIHGLKALGTRAIT
ncbi:MAG: hypothetical protein OER80_06740 [Gammaproteobacteria bacterium]|nr:hypothetical protein [Gammaproteobacteria bacterium]MDH3767608.1 hypothetical protein [Gammaproteobacteria bacterium]